MVRVLLTFSGRKDYVVHALMGTAGVERVVATDADPAAIVQYAGSVFEVVPMLTRQGEYLDALSKLCRAHDIDVVFPLNDLDLSALTAHRDIFAASGTSVATVPSAAHCWCADKLEMAQWLESHGIPHVPTYAFDEAWTKLDSPFVVKARSGQGSEGFAVVDSLDAVDPDARDSLIVQPMAQGAEWAVDVFGVAGEPRACLTHRKVAIVGGDMFVSRPAHGGAVARLGERVFRALGGHCNLDIDVIEYDGGVAVLDINARLGGTFGFTHAVWPEYAEALVASFVDPYAPVPEPPTLTGDVIYKSLLHRVGAG